MVKRLRDAIDFCKDECEFVYKNDLTMPAEDRMKMEHCLVKNYLLVHGMDYFGKKDFIYLDMAGTLDVNRMGGADKFVQVPNLRE